MRGSGVFKGRNLSVYSSNTLCTLYRPGTKGASLFEYNGRSAKQLIFRCGQTKRETKFISVRLDATRSIIPRAQCPLSHAHRLKPRRTPITNNPLDQNRRDRSDSWEIHWQVTADPIIGDVRNNVPSNVTEQCKFRDTCGAFAAIVKKTTNEFFRRKQSRIAHVA